MIFSLSIANFFGQNFYYKIGASQATVLFHKVENTEAITAKDG